MLLSDFCNLTLVILLFDQSELFVHYNLNVNNKILCLSSMLEQKKRLNPTGSTGGWASWRICQPLASSSPLCRTVNFKSWRGVKSIESTQSGVSHGMEASTGWHESPYEAHMFTFRNITSQKSILRGLLWWCSSTKSTLKCHRPSREMKLTSWKLQAETEKFLNQSKDDANSATQLYLKIDMW